MLVNSPVGGTIPTLRYLHRYLHLCPQAFEWRWYWEWQWQHTYGIKGFWVRIDFELIAECTAGGLEQVLTDLGIPF